MTEFEIITKLQLELSPAGWRFHRTVPGLLWKGKLVKGGSSTTRLTPIVILQNPTPFKLFPVGEPDLHLTRPVTITPDMVGQTILQFGKAEVKTARYKKVTQAQRENLETTARMGGLAYVIQEQPDGSLEWEEVTG